MRKKIKGGTNPAEATRLTLKQQSDNNIRRSLREEQRLEAELEAERSKEEKDTFYKAMDEYDNANKAMLKIRDSISKLNIEDSKMDINGGQNNFFRLKDPEYFIGIHPYEYKYSELAYTEWINELDELDELEKQNGGVQTQTELWLYDKYFTDIKNIEKDSGFYTDEKKRVHLTSKMLHNPSTDMFKTYTELKLKKTDNTYLTKNIDILLSDSNTFRIFEIENKLYSGKQVSYTKPLYQLILLAPSDLYNDPYWIEYTDNLTIRSDKFKELIRNNIGDTAIINSTIYNDDLKKNHGIELYNQLLRDPNFIFEPNKMYFLQIFIYKFSGANKKVKDYIALSINECNTSDQSSLIISENKLNNIDIDKIKVYFEKIKEYLYQEDNNHIKPAPAPALAPAPAPAPAPTPAPAPAPAPAAEEAYPPSSLPLYLSPGTLYSKFNFPHLIEEESNNRAMKKMEDYRDWGYNKPGGKKTSKKEVLGKMRCIYKIPGDRKEYVKYKGKLITVKDYKMLNKKPKTVTNKKPKTVAKDKKAKRPKKKST